MKTVHVRVAARSLPIGTQLAELDRFNLVIEVPSDISVASLHRRVGFEVQKFCAANRYHLFNWHYLTELQEKEGNNE